MKKERGKPRRLKPTVRALIYDQAIRYKNMPREFLANKLISEIEELGELPPSFETCKRMISKARNSDNPLEQPWSLGVMSKYPEFFPPESAYIMANMIGGIRVYGDYGHYVGIPPGPQYSIRQAIWITRIYPIIKGLFNFDERELQSKVNRVSNAYRIAEIASELDNEESFDTWELDHSLIEGNFDKIKAWSDRNMRDLALSGQLDKIRFDPFRPIDEEPQAPEDLINSNAVIVTVEEEEEENGNVVIVTVEEEEGEWQ